MSLDAETWLLDAGDEVIAKKAKRGAASLSDVERAIYCLWVLDYAVRNSGSFGPMNELYPSAKDELLAFAQARKLEAMAAWLVSASDEGAFCADYYSHFDKTCSELRKLAQ